MNTIRLWLPNYLLIPFFCFARARRLRATVTGSCRKSAPLAGSGVRRLTRPGCRKVSPGTPGTYPDKETCRLVLHEDRSATSGPPSCCLSPLGGGSTGQGCSRVEVEPGAQPRPPNPEFPKDPEFEQGNDPPLFGRGERPVCCKLNDASLNFLRKLDQEPLVY